MFSFFPSCSLSNLSALERTSHFDHLMCNHLMCESLRRTRLKLQKRPRSPNNFGNPHLWTRTSSQISVETSTHSPNHSNARKPNVNSTKCNTSSLDEMRTITASPKSNLSFKEKVALQGKPRLGEIRKVQVRIKESKEFKVSIANLIYKRASAVVVWRTFQRFSDSLSGRTSGKLKRIVGKYVHSKLRHSLSISPFSGRDS